MEEEIRLANYCEELLKIDWFSNCGKGGEELDIFYENCYAADFFELEKYCFSERWKKIHEIEERKMQDRINNTYYKNAGGNTSYYTKIYVDAGIKKINMCFEKIYVIIENKWKEKIGRLNQIVEFIKQDLYFKALRVYFQDGFEKYSYEFFNELFEVYKKGYVPCGWMRTFPDGKLIVF